MLNCILLIEFYDLVLPKVTFSPNFLSFSFVPLSFSYPRPNPMGGGAQLYKPGYLISWKILGKNKRYSKGKKKCTPVITAHIVGAMQQTFVMVAVDVVVGLVAMPLQLQTFVFVAALFSLHSHLSYSLQASLIGAACLFVTTLLQLQTFVIVAARLVVATPLQQHLSRTSVQITAAVEFSPDETVESAPAEMKI